MSDMLSELLAPSGLEEDLFPPNSRYRGIQIVTIESSDGEQVAYLRRRFVPPPESFSTIQEHTVTQGDRLDNLANQYLGDPELFWRLCDANWALRPDELVETVGRRLRITLPAGIPGGDDNA